MNINLDKIMKDSMNDMGRRYAFYKSTPRIIIKGYGKGNHRIHRLGECSLFKRTDAGNVEDGVMIASTVYPLTLHKAFVKFITDEDSILLDNIEKRIEMLHNGKNEIIKQAWKNAKKPVWEDDIQGISEQKKIVE